MAPQGHGRTLLAGRTALILHLLNVYLEPVAGILHYFLCVVQYEIKNALELNKCVLNITSCGKSKKYNMASTETVD